MTDKNNSILKLILDNNWADLNKYIKIIIDEKVKSKIDQKKTNIVKAINEDSEPDEENSSRKFKTLSDVISILGDDRSKDNTDKAMNFIKSNLDPVLDNDLAIEVLTFYRVDTDDENIKKQLSDFFQEDENVDEIIKENNSDKRIVITYQTFSPESLESGDVEDQGFKDEEGESMIPDEYDYEDDITAVDKAIDFLKKNGANEPSSSHFNTGVWYSTSDPDIDYKSGNETYYSYHLKGFTTEEEQEIFQKIKRRN